MALPKEDLVEFLEPIAGYAVLSAPDQKGSSMLNHHDILD